MKKNILLFVGLFLLHYAFSQNFNGQWKGELFYDSSSYIGVDNNKGEYWLDIEVIGTKVSGVSHTYFKDDFLRYTNICRIEGFIDTVNQYIQIKELELVKTTVPNTIRNCFGIHRLYYSKQGKSEFLEGKWYPVPTRMGQSQRKGCGFGTTKLAKRPPKKIADSLIAKNTLADSVRKKLVKIDTVITKGDSIAFEKRINTVLKTIEVDGDSILVDLYDNGEIDGDNISLFYNGKLVLWHKTLSLSPISLHLKVDYTKLNELTMYAENLGTFPPNTALMIVTDGKIRHEVRIISDLQKSGTIRFIHKPGDGK